jgi:hypothetical protein
VPGIGLALVRRQASGKEKIVKLRLAVIATLAMGVAHAQPSDKFRGLDRNGDGFLSKEEVGHLPGYDRAFDQGRVLLSGFVDTE